MSEYLISLEELNRVEDDEPEESEEQLDLFENIVDFIHQCPICKRKRTHLDWWTCKECSRLSIQEYNKYLFKIFGEKI